MVVVVGIGISRRGNHSSSTSGVVISSSTPGVVISSSTSGVVIYSSTGGMVSCSASTVVVVVC